MSLKFVWLKRLYVSHRNWRRTFSPTRMFLNIARLKLMSPGRRSKFLDALPISPLSAGRERHEALMKTGVPSAAFDAPLFGSQITNGRAFTCPPVKSVMSVHSVAPVWMLPAGQLCPAAIEIVPVL